MTLIRLPKPFDLICHGSRTLSDPDSLLFAGTSACHLGILDTGRAQITVGKYTEEVGVGDLWAVSEGSDNPQIQLSDEVRGIAIALTGPDVAHLVELWGISDGRLSAPARLAHRSSLLLQQLHSHIQTTGLPNPFYILTRLLRIAEYQYENDCASQEERRNQIIVMMEEAWLHKPSASLIQIARQLRVSTTTLRNCCHHVKGMSPHDYLNRLKQDLVKGLLFKTDSKILYIAHQAGFPNEKYFITWFKHLEGQTPGEWRRRIRGN